MSYSPIGDIRNSADSIYKLTIIAAKRAVELNNGSPKLIETDLVKASTIALEEIRQGKVRYQVKEHNN